MGQHHRRDDDAVTVTIPVVVPAAGPSLAPFAPVPHDAPPAGLGYPAPTAYRPHPVTGLPTPPRGIGPARRLARTGTRAPLTLAVAGAAVGLLGVGSQLPGLVDAVTATSASTAPTSSTGPTSSAAPAVAGQCATVVADALDGTVTDLGRAPSGQWDQVVADREQGLAATYGDASREQRAYAEGVDDILGWLRDGSTEDYGAVTTRVARTVATSCGA